MFSLPNAIKIAKAAYLPEDDIRKVTDELGYSRLGVLEQNSTQAFVASNESHILIAFRGTEPREVRDWITDVRFLSSPWVIGNVHRGFKYAYLSIAERLHRELELAGVDEKPISLVGHSLGAALVTLAVTDLVGKFGCKIEELTTFGSPRCGDDEFAAATKLLPHNVRRYVNNNDIVTRVPFAGPAFLQSFLPWYLSLSNWNFSHVGKPKYFTSGGKMIANPNLWILFFDRLRGRIQNWKFDGIHDHLMENYESVVDNLGEQS